MVIRKVGRKVFYLIEMIIGFFEQLLLPIKVGKKCVINGIVQYEGTCNVEIKDSVHINSGKQYNVIGGDCRTVLRTVYEGRITIGEGSGISNSTIVSANQVKIGKNVLIGGSCKIYDTDFHPINMDDRISNNSDKIKTSPIEIKDNVFIGAHCIILKGVIIGKGSVVGAGSVVTKSIPEGEVWAGNPARYIRKI